MRHTGEHRPELHYSEGGACPMIGTGRAITTLLEPGEPVDGATYLLREGECVLDTISRFPVTPRLLVPVPIDRIAALDLVTEL